MARAKCKYCREWLDTKEAIKNEKNQYYCNKTCQDADIKAMDEKAKIDAEYNEIYELTKEVFGYEFTGYSLLRKEINTWEKVGTRAKIISYLQDNKSWLSNVMSKEFTSDFHRVRYYSTVVSSKLHDFKPKVIEVEKPKIATEEHYETKYKPKIRKALSDIEEDCDEE